MDEAMQYSVTELAQGICPDGWHIPSDSEQYILENSLKDTVRSCVADRSNNWDCVNAGSKLSSLTLNGNNSSGFTGLLAGDRETDGSFFARGYLAYFWSSTISGPDAWGRYLNFGYEAVYRGHGNRAYGFSVRCLQD